MTLRAEPPNVLFWLLPNRGKKKEPPSERRQSLLNKKVITNITRHAVRPGFETVAWQQ